MTITAQRILTEMGNRAWSGFNRDDMIWGNEDALTAQAELNSAVRYLINLVDFPFRAQQQQFKTRAGNNNYTFPDGQIDTIFNTETLQRLKFKGDISEMETDKTGEPEYYCIDYSNPSQNLRLYPTPNSKYIYKIVYNTFKPVMNADGTELKFEFENSDDVINMPEIIDYLFLDCLVLRTMVTNNKDEQDENYRPTINEFNEAWKNFLRASKPAKKETYIIW